MSFFTDILNPDKYHGHGRKAPFFEGWYYKIISQDEKAKYAIIPGVILGKSSHAFIQLLDGSTRRSIYRVFPLDVFNASEEKFEVNIEGNQFTRQHIRLEIDDQDGTLQGELSFEGLTPWPVSILSPGIMGWYAWVPKMETYHGVVSLNHRLKGLLNINNESLDFSGGLGYIEKDWGAAFPAAYIWFQTNHFEQEGTSITASTAIIPWMRSAFRGFICGLWHQGQLYRFATYTGARIEDLKVFEDHIEWVLRDRRYRLEMRASRPQGGSLLGPDRVEMGKRIVETMSSTVEVRLSALGGQELFAGVGRHAGLEAHGSLDRLLNMQ